MVLRPTLVLVLLAAQPPAEEPLPRHAIARLGTLRLRQIGIPNTHTIAAVAYAPNGKLLATTAGYGGVVLWDANTGRKLRTIDMPGAYIYGLAFSADGKRITYVANEGVANNGVLDLETGKRLWHAPGGTFAAFLPDGTVLACDNQGRPAVRNADTGEVVRGLFDDGAHRIFQAFALSQDGETLAVLAQVREPGKTYYSGIELTLSTPATGKRRRVDCAVSQYSHVALAPDGKLLAVAESRVLTVIDVATGKVVHQLASEPHCLYAGSLFSPDGKTLIAVDACYEPKKLAQQRTVLRLLDLETGKEQGRLGAPAMLTGLVISPDGKRLAGVGCGFAPCVWDLPTRQPVAQFDGHRVGVRWLRFGPNGKTLVSGDRETGVLWWHLSERRVTGRLAVGAVLAMDIFPDGKTLAVHNAAKRLTVVDGITGKVRFELEEFCTAVAASPDGKLLVRAEYDGVLHFIDAATGQETQRLKAHKSDILGLCLSGDARIVLAASHTRQNNGLELHIEQPPADDSVSAWNMTTGRLLARWDVKAECVALSPDGKLAAVGRAGSGELLLWDVASGKRVRTLALGAQVRALAFSPDGRTLAAGTDDGVVRLIEAVTGGERRQLRGHAAAVESLAWSPDSRLLASGCADTTILVWAVNK